MDFGAISITHGQRTLGLGDGVHSWRETRSYQEERLSQGTIKNFPFDLFSPVAK